MSSKQFVRMPASAWAALVKRDLWLQALEHAGVDNWEGISYAYEIFEEMQSEEEKPPGPADPPGPVPLRVG